jgi:biopolymer transport protein ExbB/TolQ
VGFALFGVAWVNGFIDMIRAGDDTHQCDAIFVVFLAGLFICGARILQASRELNAAREYDPAVPSETARYLARLRECGAEGRGIVAGALRLRLSHRIAVVRHIGSTLVLLGLLGTVVGFIIALSGVDPQKASEIAAISPMVSTLIRGMSTALYTTLVGCVLNIWLMVNYRLLATGTVKLITTITELGERHGRA